MRLETWDLRLKTLKLETTTDAIFHHAQRISGCDVPNMIVYGGGHEIHEYCMKHSLLYVTDFMTEKGECDNG